MPLNLNPTGDSAVDKEAELKALCREYFLAQQSLRSAEEEAVHLQSTALGIQTQIKVKERDALKLEGLLEKLKEAAKTLKHYGPNTTLEMAEAHMSEEKKLHTAISVSEGQLKDALRRKNSLSAQLHAESKTVNILKDSLTSQGKYNASLVSSLTQTLESHRRTQQRLAETKAQRVTLEEQKLNAQKTTKKMQSSVRARDVGKHKAQEALHDYDLDTLRMRKEAAYAKRVYLSEVEHGREQELFLQQLLSENRKLKIIAANRKVRVPGVNTGGTGAAATSSSSADGVAAPSIQEVLGVELNGDEEGYVTDVVDAQETKAQALAQYRTENKKLMQQVIDTMNLLQFQLKEQQDATSKKINRHIDPEELKH